MIRFSATQNREESEGQYFFLADSTLTPVDAKSALYTAPSTFRTFC